MAHDRTSGEFVALVEKSSSSTPPPLVNHVSSRMLQLVPLAARVTSSLSGYLSHIAASLRSLSVFFLTTLSQLNLAARSPTTLISKLVAFPFCVFNRITTCTDDDDDDNTKREKAYEASEDVQVHCQLSHMHSQAGCLGCAYPPWRRGDQPAHAHRLASRAQGLSDLVGQEAETQQVRRSYRHADRIGQVSRLQAVGSSSSSASSISIHHPDTTVSSTC